MASLITSRGQKNSSQDFYGNVKIPVLDRIVPRNSIETDAWKTMDHSQEVPYSSLLGIPVVGIPSTGNLSFNLVSRYFNVECTDPVNEDSSLMFMDPPPTGVEAAYYIRQKGGTFVIQSPLDYPANYTGSWSFNFTSINMNTATFVSHANCTMSPQDVESSVYCSDQSCRVTAMRYLPNKFVSLSNLYSDYIKPSLELLPLSSLGALNHGPIYPSSITELWLQNPYANYGGCIMRSVNLSTTTGVALSKNFETLFNTYWQSTFGSRYLFGDLSTTDTGMYDNIGNFSTSDVARYGSIDFNTSQTTIINYDGEQYICNKMFAGFLITISSLLFLTSMASLLLSTMTLAPDILGYVSSLTRDNPFTRNDEASHLDGLDRAKALNNMKVAIGDVGGQSESGYVAFGAAENVMRLQRNRLYR